MRRRSSLALAVLGGALLQGCAATGEDARPFVIRHGGQLADLYARGELTDGKGNLWDVKLLPGTISTLESARGGLDDAGTFLAEVKKGEFWEKRAEDVHDGLDFSGRRCLRELVVEGIQKDYGDTTTAIGDNVRDTPFGWIPRIVGNAAWGFVAKPVGRVIGGTLGATGGVGYAALAPVVQVAARPLGAVGICAGKTVVVPTGKLLWHHAAYPLVLVNREPAEKHDGEFGLKILRRAGGDAPSPAPAGELLLTPDEENALVESFLVDERQSLEDLLLELEVERVERAKERELEALRRARERRRAALEATKPRPSPGGAPRARSPEELERLMSKPWPGLVREADPEGALGPGATGLGGALERFRRRYAAFAPSSR